MPVFNNDAIRFEIIEDLGKFNNTEHIKRRDIMIKEIIKNGVSFICDTSVDRKWKKFKELLDSSGYHYFIISLDLSKNLLAKLYKIKGYFESLKQIDELFNDHKMFLNEYSNDVNISISDDDFKNRCQISYKKTAEWIKYKKEF